MISSVDTLSLKYPNARLLIIGYLKTIKTDKSAEHSNLVQLVDKPTREADILNMIFTNCKRKCSSPRTLPPVAASDYNCILLWHG
jgi:hypothetical protein